MNTCCQNPANLETVSTTELMLNGKRVEGATMTMPATETIRRCRVCGCRHFEIVAEPLRLNLRGGST